MGPKTEHVGPKTRPEGAKEAKKGGEREDGKNKEKKHKKRGQHKPVLANEREARKLSLHLPSKQASLGKTEQGKARLNMISPCAVVFGRAARALHHAR